MNSPLSADLNELALEMLVACDQAYIRGKTDNVAKIPRIASTSTAYSNWRVSQPDLAFPKT